MANPNTATTDLSTVGKCVKESLTFTASEQLFKVREYVIILTSCCCFLM